MSDLPRPVVGVQAIVTKKRRPRSVLLARRKNIFGSGQWGFPGGHLEFGESFEGAARRELAEETGLNARELYVWKSINTPYERTHYVQIGVQVAQYHGEIQNLEPDKCSELRWCWLDDLPTPLFAPSVPFLRALQTRDRLPTFRDAEPSLQVYLFGTSTTGRSDRFITYLILGRPPRVFIRRGRRGERERELRQYAVETDQDALDVLRTDIDHRLSDGYRLFDVRGSYSVEVVRSLFPDGSVAFRALRGTPDQLLDEELAVHRELERNNAQLSLFDADMPRTG